MNTDRKITIISNRRKRILQVSKILGVHMRRKHADVYMSDGEVIETRHLQILKMYRLIN